VGLPLGVLRGEGKGVSSRVAISVKSIKKRFSLSFLLGFTVYLMVGLCRAAFLEPIKSSFLVLA
jgi:hypothetical protein